MNPKPLNMYFRGVFTYNNCKTAPVVSEMQMKVEWKNEKET